MISKCVISDISSRQQMLEAFGRRQRHWGCRNPPSVVGFATLKTRSARPCSRGTQGVNLTRAGQRFLHRARHALDHIRDGAAEVAAIGRAEGGYLKVGLFSSLSSGFLSTLFRAYDARHGSVQAERARQVDIKQREGLARLQGRTDAGEVTRHDTNGFAARAMVERDI